MQKEISRKYPPKKKKKMLWFKRFSNIKAFQIQKKKKKNIYIYIYIYIYTVRI